MPTQFQKLESDFDAVVALVSKAVATMDEVREMKTKTTHFFSHLQSLNASSVGLSMPSWTPSNDRGDICGASCNRHCIPHHTTRDMTAHMLLILIYTCCNQIAMSSCVTHSYIFKGALKSPQRSEPGRHVIIMVSLLTPSTTTIIAPCFAVGEERGWWKGRGGSRARPTVISARTTVGTGSHQREARGKGIRAQATTFDQ